MLTVTPELRRLLEISHKHKLSHLGSCITALPIIQKIYREKRAKDPFVLSSGHAGLALYVVLEEWFKHNGLDDYSAEYELERNGIHPQLEIDGGWEGIDCSTGSLGQGLPIAVGMALADKDQNVYCLTSDGEWAEGSMWEALRVAEEQALPNIQIHVNMNGYGAYGEIDKGRLVHRISSFAPGLNSMKQIRFHHTDVEEFPFLNGLDAHYYVMTDKDYLEITERMKHGILT